MSSDRQNLIRQFAVAIAGGYFANANERWQMNAQKVWEEAAKLADIEPAQPPADDRIERALQLLRDAQAYDWVEADVLSEVRRILEGENNG